MAWCYRLVASGTFGRDESRFANPIKEGNRENSCISRMVSHSTNSHRVACVPSGPICAVADALDYSNVTSPTGLTMSARETEDNRASKRSFARDDKGARRSLYVSANLLVLALGLLMRLALQGCRPQKDNSSPSIEFTKIPPAAQGGSERVATIAGRVRNARPGQQIVIYAHSGTWWVQPSPGHELIPIQADSTFSIETHLGFEYAALLVDPGYHALRTMDVAPAQGGLVAYLRTVKGTGTPQLAPTGSLKFSGYDWDVRTIASDKGGTNNPYDPENAWTDTKGALHLEIKKKNGRWTCAEIFSKRSLGYGTYTVTVRDTSHLEPAAVFGFFTFDESNAEEHYREMDIEVSRWGDPASKNNAQYAIQPSYNPGNLYAFAVPAGPLTYSLQWEPGHATFETIRGRNAGAGAPVVFQHEFTSGVPSAEDAKARLILYVVASEKSPLKRPTEVVVEKFEYLR
jgi:hypothetical protein